MKKLHRFAFIPFVTLCSTAWGQLTLTPNAGEKDSFTANVQVTKEGTVVNGDFSISKGTLTSESTSSVIDLTITAVTDYSPKKAKEAASMGTFAAYLDELPSAPVVGQSNYLGVQDQSVDTGEVLILTVSDLNLNENESLVIPRVGTRQYTRDDSSDFFVYDFSENQIALSELNRTGAGTQVFEASNIALEKGDKLVFAAGPSRTPSWRHGQITVNLVPTEGLAPKTSVPSPTSGSASEENYSYVGMNGKSHMIKAFFPDREKHSGDRPCAIFFHGGGWSGGSYEQFNRICDYLAGRGIVAITADYSLLTKEQRANLPEGESRKRICVIDGKTVIRWVKANATNLGIDPNRIVAGGGSAGGHIAVLAMMDQDFNNPADPPGVDSSVNGFLLFCPAFTKPKSGQTPDVNVFSHLESNWPPTLFLVGETDGWKKASDALAAELKERSVDVENWMAPDKGHMYFGRDPWLGASLQRMDDFLVARGFLEGESGLTPTEETMVTVPSRR